MVNMDPIVEIEDIPPPPAPRRRRRLISPTRVTLVESQQAYDKLLERVDKECAPRDVQQESDALAHVQMRWRAERLDSIQNQRLNWMLVHNTFPGDTRTNEERLMFAYYACAADPAFAFTEKQHLALLKSLHSLNARIEKWKSTSTSRRKSDA